ncbi:MAG: transposase [Chitinophagales bacterium]|nr:transposase [Chitinophagales bacterium]
MDINQAYFYTETIQDFAHLLADDNLKMVVVESWQYLVQNKLIEIYAYVIMPNHIHLLWNILSANGKESPSGSFSKYTAHRFKKYLQQYNPDLLMKFISDK